MKAKSVKVSVNEHGGPITRLSDDHFDQVRQSMGLPESTTKIHNNLADKKYAQLYMDVLHKPALDQGLAFCPFETEYLWDKMFRQNVYAGRFGIAIHAMSGVDIALWDIKGSLPRRQGAESQRKECWRRREASCPRPRQGWSWWKPCPWCCMCPGCLNNNLPIHATHGRLAYRRAVRPKVSTGRCPPRSRLCQRPVSIGTAGIMIAGMSMLAAPIS